MQYGNPNGAGIEIEGALYQPGNIVAQLTSPSPAERRF
jgi:hypothetical protein